MPTDTARALAAEIEKMSPPDRLRLAADIMEAGRPDLVEKVAYPLIERVKIELGAALALRRHRG